MTIPFNRLFVLFFSVLNALMILSCTGNETKSKKQITQNDFFSKENSPLNKKDPFSDNGTITAIIEIPAGSIEKWEMNKKRNQIERDSVDGKPRTINYLGYPANYGFIPKTLLPKEKGGDGDPLDIIVIGDGVKRGDYVKCKIIGVLYLLDNGEQDDKLIAIAENSPLYHINNLNQLKENYNGITQIIELWFTNYKGLVKIQSKGFGNKNEALTILKLAFEEFNSTKND